jgi:drug/metabolite transporter (DMT)-like permease
MNILNGRLFLGKPIDRIVLIGSLTGLIGISIVFAPNISEKSHIDQLGAIALCVAGTYLSSIGNILSGINQSRSVSVASGNTLAMIYAAIFLAVFCFFKGSKFEFDYSTQYIGSLIYLAVFGSVLAFYFYLTLLGRIGSDRAVYAMLLFPVIALFLSSIYEGLSLSPNTLVGFSIVMAGNFLVLLKPVHMKAVLWKLWSRS